MSKLTRDGTAETVSRDKILRRERAQGNINFPCSDDHEQDWQPYPVDPYSCYMCDDTYIHTLRCVCVRVCIYYISHNRAIRPCHPSHSMPLELILPKGFKGSTVILVCVCVAVCVCVYIHVSIELHITTQSDPVLLFNSHPQGHKLL